MVNCMNLLFFLNKIGLTGDKVKIAVSAVDYNGKIVVNPQNSFDRYKCDADLKINNIVNEQEEWNKERREEIFNNICQKIQQEKQIQVQEKQIQAENASSNESFCNVFDSCCDCMRDYYNGVPFDILFDKGQSLLTNRKINNNLILLVTIESTILIH